MDENEKGRLAQELSQLKIKYDKLRVIRKKQQKEIENLNQQKENYENQLNQINERIKIQVEYDQINQNYSVLKDEHQCNLQNIEKLNYTIKVINDELKHIHITRKNIKRKTIETINRIQKMTQVANHFKPDPEIVEKVDEINAKLEKKRIIWKEEKVTFLKEINDTKQNIEEKKRDVDEIHQQIEEREGLITEFQKKGERRQKSIEDLSSELQASEEHLKELKSEIQKINQKFKNIKQKEDFLTSQSVNVNEEVEMYEQKYKEALRQYNELVDDMEETKAKLSTSQKELNKQFEKERIEITTHLNQESIKKDDEISDLQKELENLKIVYQQVQEQLTIIEDKNTSEQEMHRKKIEQDQEIYNSLLRQLYEISGKK